MFFIENGHAVQPAENAAELATRISLTGQINLDQQVAEQLRETIRQLQKDFDRLGTRVRKLEEKSNQHKVLSGKNELYLFFTLIDGVLNF